MKEFPKLSKSYIVRAEVIYYRGISTYLALIHPVEIHF